MFSNTATSRLGAVKRPIALAAGALVLASSLVIGGDMTPAHAAGPTCVETDNDGGNNGGKACWYRGAQRFTVADIDKDGRSAWARVKYRKGGHWKKLPPRVASGEGSNSNGYIHAPRHRKARLTVCLQESGDRLGRTCDSRRIRT